MLLRESFLLSNNSPIIHQLSFNHYDTIQQLDSSQIKKDYTIIMVGARQSRRRRREPYFFLDQTGYSLVVSLTSTSRLTTPVDLLLGFFLRWLDGWRVEDEEEVLADAEVLVVAVLFVEDVIVTEGTSECSVKWNTTNKS